MEIGKACPNCKKGKIYPTGKVEDVERGEASHSTSPGRDNIREFKCDECGKKFYEWEGEIKMYDALYKEIKKRAKNIPKDALRL